MLCWRKICCKFTINELTATCIPDNTRRYNRNKKVFKRLDWYLLYSLSLQQFVHRMDEKWTFNYGSYYCLLILSPTVDYSSLNYKALRRNISDTTLYYILKKQIFLWQWHLFVGCGQPNRISSRVQGGEFSETHEFPWLVAIILNGTQVSSGALINDRYVITSNAPLAG